MVDYVYFYRGASIAYATSIDALAGDLTFFRPTILAVVPRVLEKFHEKILRAVSEFPGGRRKTFDAAIAAARETLERRQRGEPPGAGL